MYAVMCFGLKVTLAGGKVEVAVLAPRIMAVSSGVDSVGVWFDGTMTEMSPGVDVGSRTVVGLTIIKKIVLNEAVGISFCETSLAVLWSEDAFAVHSTTPLPPDRA